MIQKKLLKWVLLITVLHSLEVSAEEKPAQLIRGLQNESEAGIVMTTGNTDLKNFNFKQTNSYEWAGNLFKFTGRYLTTSNKKVETSHYSLIGLRYQREILHQKIEAFAGQNTESNPFSGYNQRYNSDLGAKHFIYHYEEFLWDIEAGYRYTIENRTKGQYKQNYLRFFTEINYRWNNNFSTQFNFEYLIDLSPANIYQLNTEFSVLTTLTEIFMIKVGYVVKYRNQAPPPAITNTDTQFTTLLVAKF